MHTRPCHSNYSLRKPTSSKPHTQTCPPDRQFLHSTIHSPKDPLAIRKRAKHACHYCRLKKCACNVTNSNGACDLCLARGRDCWFVKAGDSTDYSNILSRYVANCY